MSHPQCTFCPFDALVISPRTRRKHGRACLLDRRNVGCPRILCLKTFQVVLGVCH